MLIKLLPESYDDELGTESDSNCEQSWTGFFLVESVIKPLRHNKLLAYCLPLTCQVFSAL